MKKLVAFLIHRSILGNLVTVGVVVAGVFALSNMNREVFPNVNFDIVTVTVLYPGASPQEVEKLITIPIERELKSVDGIKKSSSSSIESRSGMGITLDPDFENKRKIIQDIKDAVDRAKIDFPQDAEEPIVTEITTDRQPIIEIALSNKSSDPEKKLNEFQLREYADQLADQIELLPDTAAVNKRGYREREIHVEVFPDKLEYYNISTDEISQALQTRNLNFPGGNITQGGVEYSIRTVKEFQNIDEIKNLIIRANDLGGAVRIKDVAQVKNDYEDIKVMEKANGQEAIILTVLKKQAGDAIDMVNDVLTVIDKFKESSSESLEVFTFNDLSFYIKRRLKVLINNVAIGLVLVALCLVFFLGWRVSLMVAIGLPFAFAITFLLMYQFDITINLISVFGLIIATGMVVDDAIIVGENIYRHIEGGMPPTQAAVRGVQEMLAPVFGAITTTCIAFLPLMFMSGIMGKFVWVLPAAVIISLAASLIESFFILPAHISDISRSDVLLHQKKSQKLNMIDRISLRLQSVEKVILNSIKKIYLPLLKWALEYRYLSIIFVIGLFITALMLTKKIGFILFPKEGIEILQIKAEAEPGVNLRTMNKKMDIIEDAVANLPKKELDSFTSRIGIHQKEANDPFTKRGKNYAQINVFLTPEQNRDRKAKEIVAYLQRKMNQEKPIYAMIPVSRDLVNEQGSYYLRIENSPYIQLLQKNEPYNIKRKIKINNEFLLGGGAIHEGRHLVAYSGANEFFHFDINQNKKIFSKKLDLKDFDAVIQFVVDPNGKFGLIYTERGFFYQIDLEDGNKSLLKHYNGNITSVSFVPQEKIILLSHDNGLDIWKYNENDLEMKRSLREAPKYVAREDKFYNDKKMNLGRVEYAFFDQGHILLGTFFGIFQIYDLKTDKFLESYKISEKPILWVMRDPIRKDVIWVSENDLLFCYDLKNKTIESRKSILGTIMYSVNNASNKSILLGKFTSAFEIDHEKMEVTALKKVNRRFEKIDFEQLGGGPPVGAPVQVEIRGDNFDTSLEIADKIKDILGKIDGVYDIRDNWEEGKEEFHTQINEQRAAMAGVSVAQIASSLQTAFEGRVSTSIKEAKEEIDIRVIFPKNLREDISSLRKVKIRNQYGRLVPIQELASFSKAQGVPLISHADFRRTVYVKGNIDETRNSSVAANQELFKYIPDISKDYPGYDVVAGGEYEDTQESLDGLIFSGFSAVLGIGLILVLLFGNLRSPRVIMSAIPLGFIGVVFAFFIHKMFFLPNLVFSFLASMGIVGLTGVVVNDSIVLVDFITKLRYSGMNKIDAIIGGCLTRLRPVILTTITTVFGLLPTAYGLGGDDPFLKPMALALSWGLAFASLITLLVTPTYYAIWEDRGFVFHHVKESFPGIESALLKIDRKKNKRWQKNQNL